MNEAAFVNVAFELDQCGLLWRPVVGDEVSERNNLESISILVNPKRLSLSELRDAFIWLPTVEQLVVQFEARQALVYHAGINASLKYEVVVKSQVGIIEVQAPDIRTAFGKALNGLLVNSKTTAVH